VSGEAISAQLDAGDVAELQRQMRRAIVQLGKDSGEALRWAAWSLAKTLGTSTRIAPKHRKVRKVGDSLDRKSELFEVESFRSGTARTSKMWASSRTEALNSTRARIGNRGLAKSAWSWGIKALGSGGAFPSGTSSRMVRLAQSNLRTEKQLTGEDMHVTLDNRLRYAGLAFKSSGQQTVSSAMSRAARMMQRTINAKIYGSKWAK
jgi:hypothetical protein